MAFIARTSTSGSGIRRAPVTTLGASDNIEFTAGKNQILVLHNVTGSILAPRITGSDAGTANVSGIGSVDLSAGYLSSPTIPAGEYSFIPLDSIDKWLQGVVTITEGAGIEAFIIESP